MKGFSFRCANYYLLPVKASLSRLMGFRFSAGGTSWAHEEDMEQRWLFAGKKGVLQIFNQMSISAKLGPILHIFIEFKKKMVIFTVF